MSSSFFLWAVLFPNPSCVCRWSTMGLERSWNATEFSCSREAMCSLWCVGYENTSEEGEGKGIRGTRRRWPYNLGDNTMWQPRQKMGGREERKGVGLDMENENIPATRVAGVALKWAHRKQDHWNLIPGLPFVLGDAEELTLISMIVSSPVKRRTTENHASSLWKVLMWGYNH